MTFATFIDQCLMCLTTGKLPTVIVGKNLQSHINILYLRMGNLGTVSINKVSPSNIYHYGSGNHVEEEAEGREDTQKTNHCKSVNTCTYGLRELSQHSQDLHRSTPTMS